MSVFDSNIKDLVGELNSITNRIIDTLSEPDGELGEVDNLYNARKPFIEKIDIFIGEENNKKLILENEKEWKSMMEPLRVKDENALSLLKSKVKHMEEELKIREKQKNLLLYKENK